MIVFISSFVSNVASSGPGAQTFFLSCVVAECAPGGARPVGGLLDRLAIPAGPERHLARVVVGDPVGAADRGQDLLAVGIAAEINVTLGFRGACQSV